MSKFRNMIKKQENRAAESIGGKRHPCSGALFFAKGDASGENYTVECKRTDQKSIAIKADVLDKISREASSQGRMPLLFLEISSVAALTSKSWVLMEESQFQYLSENGKK